MRRGQDTCHEGSHCHHDITIWYLISLLDLSMSLVARWLIAGDLKGGHYYLR